MKRTEQKIVSVIVPLYNREKLISKTLDSILMQENQALIEIIVVDDGSTDEGVKVVEEYRKIHSNITLERKLNGGVCSARNVGISLAKGEFIQFLDSDDLLNPKKLVKQISALQCNANADICTSNSVYLNGDGTKTQGYVLSASFTQDNFLYNVLRHNLWHVHAPLYRRNAIERIGLWNEELSSLEDWEYSCRSAIVGCQVVHVPECLAIVRQHGGERLSRSPLRIVSQNLRTMFIKLLSELNSDKVPVEIYDQIARNLYSAGRGFIECGDTGDGVECFRDARRCARGGGLRLSLYSFSVFSKVLGPLRFLRWSRGFASMVRRLK